MQINIHLQASSADPLTNAATVALGSNCDNNGKSLIQLFAHNKSQHCINSCLPTYFYIGLLGRNKLSTKKHITSFSFSFSVSLFLFLYLCVSLSIVSVSLSLLSLSVALSTSIYVYPCLSRSLFLSLSLSCLSL